MQLGLGVEEGAEELDRVLGGDLHLAGPAQTEVGQAVPVCSNTAISNHDIDSVKCEEYIILGFMIVSGRCLL